MNLFKSALVFLAAFAAPWISGAVDQARPNVLFIVVDDLRAQLGCYGDRMAITPNLDRLASRGTLFSRAYCQQAVCGPSRASVLTGRRPDSLRVWDLKTVFRDTAPDAVSLPEYFKQNGYFARSFGKIYHDGLPDPKSWSVPAEFEAMSKREDYRLPENRAPHKAQKATATEFVDAPDDAYPDGKVAAGAVAALEMLGGDSAGQPFFLAVGIRKPHLPFTAPKKYWDLYENVEIPAVVQPAPPAGSPEIARHDSVELRGYTDQPETGAWTAEQIATLRRGYYAATSFADAQIGRVLDALERTGLAKNTIVVVWGDHGFHLGEHDLWVKTTNYEADTRVPLIVATPDERPRGVRTEAIVELVGLYPTLVELCGLPPSEQLEGRSFAENIGNSATTGEQVAFSQFPRPWMYRDEPEAMGYAVRTASHRYVEWRRFDTAEVLARELYAYENDLQFETVNLADQPQHASLLRDLAGLLPSPRSVFKPQP
jgi:iduronate 2-sulfatase